MKNKILIWLILILSFSILSLIYLYSKSNITVISYPLPNSAITHKVFDEFTVGRKISGEFSPNENYLGQVLIRFYTFNRINTDSLTFRIKEKSSDSWYYEHTYKTDQFLPDNLFTFGFPTIADSKGKTYQFQIESVNGTPDESVTLSKIDPLAALSFQYPKSLLIKNPSLVLLFLKSKLMYQEVNSDVIFSFLIYLNFIALVMLLEYIFLEKAIKYKFKKPFLASNSIIAGLLFMVLSAILYYLKKAEFSLNLTVLAYFLLVFGVVYLLFESKRSQSRK